MKLTLTIFSFLFLQLSLLQSQTPQQAVVEHFTNSRCSICAAENPQFYTDLHTNYPQVLHIAYYPSSPYPACHFSQLNPTENDARTRYYGVYGSTPRAVLQGSPLAASYPLVSSGDYSAILNQTSPFAVNIQMQDIQGDSVMVTTVIKTTGTHSYPYLHLFEVVTEDTVFYNNPNGEKVNYDVFHKQLFANNGLTFVPSTTIGDSVIIISAFYLDTTWVKSRVNVTGLVQDSTTNFIAQAARQTVIAPAAVVVPPLTQVSISPADSVSAQLQVADSLSVIDEHIYLHNTNTDSIAVSWSVDQQVPAGWTATLCDNDNCYGLPTGPHTSLKFAPGDSLDMHASFSPGYHAGTGWIKVTAQIANDTLPPVSLTYRAGVTLASGVSEVPVELNAIRLFPNPAADVINLYGVEAAGPVTLQITDIYGRVVSSGAASQGNNRYALNISTLPAGYYFIKVMGEADTSLPPAGFVKL